MASSVPAGKMPEERLSIPRRRSYSEPEDEQLCEDSFFIKNMKFTWVGKKSLLGVDDQGRCCCCWAFCATEAITVAHLKTKKELIPLSKQQLVDCMYTYNDKIKPSWFAKLEENQCYPCSYNKAYKFAMKYGIVEETKYPFTEQRGECECPSKVKIVKIKGFQNVSELGLNKKGIEKLIRQQPITCAARHVPSLKEHRGKGFINRVVPSPPPPLPPSYHPLTHDVPLSIAKETESPPQKKHKINEGDEEEIGNISSSSAETMVFSDEEDDDTSSPIIPTYSTYDSDEDYCPDYPNGKMDEAIWEKYYQQIEESEGFDITDYPGGCWMTTIYPMPYYLNVPTNVVKLNDYAGKALKHYNDSNGTSYEVDNILKVNGSGCRDFTYYLTFTIKSSENHVFQAKVVEDLHYRLEFPIVRPKVKATMG